MRLIDELVAEHALIDGVVGSFLGFAGRLAAGEAVVGDGARFLRFFRLFAGDFHHAREEGTLFPALVEHVDLPADRGPIAVLSADHRRLSEILDRIEALLARDPDAASRRQIAALATEYGHALWHHIDAENSVLLPESEARLRKRSVRELPSREMTDAEREAKRVGETLAAQYPPAGEREVIRGDGCVLCPAFADTCRGLESEWWTESEWDELEDHLSES